MTVHLLAQSFWAELLSIGTETGWYLGSLSPGVHTEPYHPILEGALLPAWEQTGLPKQTAQHSQERYIRRRQKVRHRLIMRANSREWRWNQIQHRADEQVRGSHAIRKTKLVREKRKTMGRVKNKNDCARRKFTVQRIKRESWAPRSRTSFHSPRKMRRVNMNVRAVNWKPNEGR